MALKSAFSGFFLSSKTAYTLAKTGQKQGVFCKDASQDYCIFAVQWHALIDSKKSPDQIYHLAGGFFIPSLGRPSPLQTSGPPQRSVSWRPIRIK